MPTDARPLRTRRRRVRWSQVRREWPLGCVLAGVVVALVFVLLDRWRRGAVAFGVTAVLAAVLRATLPESSARLPVVRSRAFDVVLLALVGGSTLWLASTIDALGTG